MLGLRFLGATKASMTKYFLLCSFGLIWCSLFFGFFFKSLYEDSFLFLGGAHGYYLGQWLIERIGWPGAFLVIVHHPTYFLHFRKSKHRSILARNFQNQALWKKMQPTLLRNQKHRTANFLTNLKKSWTGEIEKKPTITTVIPQNLRMSTNSDPEEEEDDEDDDYSDVNAEPESSKGVDFEIKIGQGEETDEEIEEPEIERTPAHIRGQNEDVYDASYMGDYNPRLDLSGYKYPGINLLTRYENTETIINTEEQNSNKRRIQEVLEQFGIRISSITATVGATITLYEIIPEPGVRISRIKSLENDIALSLSALGIRIIAPIPGKGTIGIEVPNREPQIVSMHGVINSKKFSETKYELPIALGKDHNKRRFHG